MPIQITKNGQDLAILPDGIDANKWCQEHAKKTQPWGAEFINGINVYQEYGGEYQHYFTTKEVSDVSQD